MILYPFENEYDERHCLCSRQSHDWNCPIGQRILRSKQEEYERKLSNRKHKIRIPKWKLKQMEVSSPATTVTNPTTTSDGARKESE